MALFPGSGIYSTTFNVSIYQYQARGDVHSYHEKLKAVHRKSFPETDGRETVIAIKYSVNLKCLTRKNKKYIVMS